MKYVNVVIDNNNDKTDRLYTYACEFDSVEVGTKVLVPFARGNRLKDAYVFQVMEELKEPINNLKYVKEIDEAFALSIEVINTVRWMRKRYLCRYIEAIHCFTPAGNPSKRGETNNPFEEAEFPIEVSKKLTDEQEAALNKISSAIEDKIHKTFLLHGVTSSGKTEIYMQAIDKVIKTGKSAIMLVPEIALTGQTIERFMCRFGAENIAVLHSKLTLRQRYDEWMRVKNHQVKILIGARSGVFAPFDNPGIIILDEEHEMTYKSDMAPKYNACEVAVKRGENAEAVVILGSATPSLDSKYKCDINEFELLQLKHRHNKTTMPKVHIADMREELKRGNKSIFSVELYDSIKENLEKNRQIILFLNRRGYSTFVSCRNCGYVMKCKECGISLTYHKQNDRAICHICGRGESVPKLCPDCGSKYLKYFGTGTEKVEETTVEMFPEARIARLDLDTSRKKGSIDRILNSFKKHKTDILIGTQLVAKGLDFANVGLVGIVSADVSLNIPDYQSSERTFQLITQAAGRTGRGEDPGKVIIQTYSPEHYSIIAAADHDYKSFYEMEIKIRKALNYPPFSDLIQITVSSEIEREAVRQSEEIVEEFNRMAGEERENAVFGPQPNYISRLKGLYRYQIIVKVTAENKKLFYGIINSLKLRINGDKKALSFVTIDIN